MAAASEATETEGRSDVTGSALRLLAVLARLPHPWAAALGEVVVKAAASLLSASSAFSQDSYQWPSLEPAPSALPPIS